MSYSQSLLDIQRAVLPEYVMRNAQNNINQQQGFFTSKQKEYSNYNKSNSNNNAASSASAAASSSGAKRGIPIELFFRGNDLLKADVLSDSDPYVVIYEIPPDAPQASSDGWVGYRTEVGRTEVIDDTLNPVWTRSILVRYVIGASQRFLIRCIDDDGLDDDRNDPLGDASFYLSDVMNAPNYTIMVALPTQGSVTITGRISLKKEGMTIERVPIPRCATVVDALQKSTRVRETGTTDISFPSSDAFWKALHQAIALAPASAQAPPHLHIEATDRGEGILVNKVFLIDFLDQWNEAVTHTLTITVGDGSRAFRAVPAMWERLLTFYSGGTVAPQDGEPTITVESNQDPHRRKVKIPWSSWVNFTKLWDATHEGDQGDTFGGEQQLDVGTAAQQYQDAQHLMKAGSMLGLDVDALNQSGDYNNTSSGMIYGDGSGGGNNLQRILYPQWTDRSQRMPCTTAIGRARNVSNSGTYWTHFMKEFSILQAAARNHLPNGSGF